MLDQSSSLGLQKGIKLFFDGNSDPQSPRIWLSSGTTQKIEPVSEHIKYQLGAFVPKEPWREPNLTEYSLIYANEPLSNLSSWDVGSYIGICRFPDEVLAPFEAILEQLGTRDKATQKEYKPLQTHPDYESAIAEVINYLPRYCLSSDKPEIIGTRVTQPELRTLTRGCKTFGVNHSNNLSEMPYIGMHLDSWDRAPLRRRPKSRNRICINLGRESRFFLFINLTLIDMFKALGLSDPEDIYKHYRGADLGDEFMKRYPDYPVVKLKVEPKEAYIAPTDNLIHDASSIGNKYPDITLTFIGYLGIPLQGKEVLGRYKTSIGKNHAR